MFDTCFHFIFVVVLFLICDGSYSLSNFQEEMQNVDIRNWAKPAGAAFWSIEAVEKVPCSPFRLSKFLSSRLVGLWVAMDFVNIYKDVQTH